MEPHNGNINDMAFIGIAIVKVLESSHLISCADDGKVALTRTKDWETVKTLRGNSYGIMQLP